MEGLTVALIVLASHRPGFWILQVIVVIFALAVLVAGVAAVLRRRRGDRPEG